MRIGLICFSQTGNTRRIAEGILEGVLEGGAQGRLIPFEAMTAGLLTAFDLVGMGCPVFYYQEPLHVRAWLESLPDQAGKPWFVFCTHGSVIGNFFPSVTGRLQGRGARVVGTFHSYAGIRVPFLPSPGLTGGHPDVGDFARARAFGREMARSGRDRSEGEHARRPAPGPVSSPKWIEDADRFSPAFLEKTMPRLHWEEDRCTRCGICQDECPVWGIQLDADPPLLQSPCIYCWNCVCRCPEQAITADWERLISMAPGYTARCRVELDREAERGNFRWLIDPDRVDGTDVYIKQQDPKGPMKEGL